MLHNYAVNSWAEVESHSIVYKPRMLPAAGAEKNSCENESCRFGLCSSGQFKTL